MDRSEIFAYMSGHRLAVLATVHAGGMPEAALVGFAFHIDVGIVFDTSSTSRKAVNLRARPGVALVIGWDDETTLQLEGIAHEPAGDALQRAKSVYFDVWPDGRDREHWPDITYFVVRPTWLRFCRFGAHAVTEEIVLF